MHELRCFGEVVGILNPSAVSGLERARCSCCSLGRAPAGRVQWRGACRRVPREWLGVDVARVLAVFTRVMALTDCAQRTMARRVETHLASLVTLRQLVPSIRTRASVNTMVAALGARSSSRRKMRMPATALMTRTAWCSSATPVASVTESGVELEKMMLPLRKWSLANAIE